MARLVQISCVIHAVAGAAVAQQHQWEAVVLHPPEMRSSRVNAVNATHQGGSCSGQLGSETQQAGVWAGSADSWTPFTPVGQLASIQGMDESRQVGSWQLPGVGRHAMTWRGTAGSALDLHPEGLMTSVAGGVARDLQVGGGQTFPPVVVGRGGLWTGTASSFVSLLPAGALQGGPGHTDGVLQGGSVIWDTNNITFATIWHGTPESAINLMPAPNTGSRVSGMAPGVQVGRVNVPGATKAALWRGSPATFTDLNPPGNASAKLLATTGTVHVGAYAQSTLSRAGVNFGTPESWVSLHQFLPPQYCVFSEATSVYQAGDTIYVGGWAENCTTSWQEAILWIGTLPCYANCDGSAQPPALSIADFTCFLHRFAAGDGYANCDQSTRTPVLNVADFTCFLQKFAVGCS